MHLLQTTYGLVLENLSTIILLTVFISFFRYFLNFYLERSRLPSGPAGLPILGYLPFLGKETHREITKLGDKYGNIFTLQLGVRNVVILNDYESVKDALSKDALLGKPDPPQFKVLGKPTAFGDDSGAEWRDQRRFSMQLMRDLGFGKGSMEDKIAQEICHLFERIEKTGRESVDIKSMLTPSMSNNISLLLFGHRFEHDDPRRVVFDQVLEKAADLFSPTSVLSTFPTWISTTLLTIGDLAQRRLIENQFKIIDNEIENHQKNFNDNSKGDYIDGYLAQIYAKKDRNDNTFFNVGKLHSNCLAFFGAGSETVRTTTEWCLLAAAHYTQFQNKIQLEIDEVVGRDRSVTYADRLRMPFTQAFICEIYRWKPIVPINLYRRTLEDTNILNHFIPKDTLVLANFWAVHHDPNIWNNPEQFDPTRFLTDDGKDLIKTDLIMPFSIGKRACAGETLARVEVFLYLTSILQKYEISSINGQKISFEEKFGLSLQPKNHPLLHFKKRY